MDSFPSPSSDSFVPPSVEAIVLDDSPMLVEDGSLVVEDEGAVRSVAELPAAAAQSDDDFIEVGDDVVFDA